MSALKAGAVVLLVALLGLTVWQWWTGRDADARERELVDRVEALQEDVAAKDSALAAVDSAARVRIGVLMDSVRLYRRRASRAGHEFDATVDTVLAAAPDSLREMIGRLRAAHDRQVSALEGEVTSLSAMLAEQDRMIDARDSLIASLRATSAAQDTLVAHLRDRLHPGFWEGLVGDLPDTAAKVGAGVLLGAVLIN